MARKIEEVFAEIETWGNVADELKNRGVKGKRDCQHACPIANFVMSETDLYEIEVNADRTFYGYDAINLEVIDNPENMDEFITNFDQGDYPELDENPEEPKHWELAEDEPELELW